jgi:hypothetical protein
MVRWTLALSIVLVAACGGGGGGTGTPAIPQVASSNLVSGEVTPAKDIPDAEEPTDAILLQLLQNCVGRITATQQQILATAVRSQRHADVIRWSLDLYEQVIATDGRLIGRDMPVRFLGLTTPPDLTGSSINVINASSVPGFPTFNAFALQDVVVMLDPLMDAFLEGAAYWDRLLEQAGDDQALVDPTELLLGLGTIFLNNSQGDFGLVVPEDEIADRIENRLFAFEAYWGAVAYVLFHELGHANLEHGLFKCLVGEGIELALADAGIVPTQQQMDELLLAFAELGRGTETQADIYAATIAERAGFSSNGAAVFVLGFLAYNAVSGNCDKFVGDDVALEVCLLGGEPENDHPPLDVRAQIAIAVIDEGQDLTHLLDILDALSIG